MTFKNCIKFNNDDINFLEKHVNDFLIICVNCSTVDNIIFWNNSNNGYTSELSNSYIIQGNDTLNFSKNWRYPIVYSCNDIFQISSDSALVSVELILQKLSTKNF